MAQPLSNVDKITIVSTGNGHSSGMSKITGDMAEIAAQVPALFESLSGMSITDPSRRCGSSVINRPERRRSQPAAMPAAKPKERRPSNSSAGLCGWDQPAGLGSAASLPAQRRRELLQRSLI